MWAAVLTLFDGEFLSTPSVWRATPAAAGGIVHDVISIHALRVEGDVQIVCPPTENPYFYPRPPCGGRLRSATLTGLSTSNFYPRPPCGGRHRIS